MAEKEVYKQVIDNHIEACRIKLNPIVTTAEFDKIKQLLGFNETNLTVAALSDDGIKPAFRIGSIQGYSRDDLLAWSKKYIQIIDYDAKKEEEKK